MPAHLRPPANTIASASGAVLDGVALPPRRSVVKAAELTSDSVAVDVLFCISATPCVLDVRNCLSLPKTREAHSFVVGSPLA